MSSETPFNNAPVPEYGTDNPEGNPNQPQYDEAALNQQRAEMVEAEARFTRVAVPAHIETIYDFVVRHLGACKASEFVGAHDPYQAWQKASEEDREWVLDQMRARRHISPIEYTKMMDAMKDSVCVVPCPGCVSDFIGQFPPLRALFDQLTMVQVWHVITPDVTTTVFHHRDAERLDTEPAISTTSWVTKSQYRQMLAWRRE